MGKVRVTKHGSKRALKRGGIPRSKQSVVVQRAFKYGLDTTDAPPNVRKYLLQKIKDRKSGDSWYDYKVYGKNIFVIASGSVLVTVLDLPKELIHEAELALSVKRKRIEAEEAHKQQYIENYIEDKDKVVNGELDKSVKNNPHTSTNNSINNSVIPFNKNIYDGIKLFILGGVGDFEYLRDTLKFLNKMGIKYIISSSVDIAFNNWSGITPEQYKEWKLRDMREVTHSIEQCTHVLVINNKLVGESDTKTGDICFKTFLKMYEAWKMEKPIYTLNKVPDNLDYSDELLVILSGNLGGELSNIPNTLELKDNTEEQRGEYACN